MTEMGLESMFSDYKVPKEYTICPNKTLNFIFLIYLNNESLSKVFFSSLKKWLDS